MKKTLFLLLGSLTIVAGIVSCNTDNNDTTPPFSSFGVVNASPGGNIDVYIGGSAAAQNFAYGSDTGYFVVTPGTYSLQVAPTATTNFLINSNVSFAPGTTYSVFTIDSMSSMKATVVVDSFSAPPSDSVRVRFLQFSPNIPPIDIATNGTVSFSNRTFNDQETNPSLAAFATLAAGNYSLEIRSAGTSTVLLPSVNLSLQGGKVYTLYARGFAGGDGGQVLSLDTLVHNQ